MLKRIYSQVYKNIVILRRNYFRLFDVTIWPLTLLFSITLFVNSINTSKEITAMVILGVIGWRAVYHLQFDMSTSYMDEYWSHSINHFLISPIGKIEFLLGNVITGIIKFLFVLILYILLGKWLFSFSIANIPVFIFGIFILGIFGIILGIISMSLMVLYHDNAYTATYIIPDLLVLLSGVYYPITIFPTIVQKIIVFIPAVYGFNILKSTIGMAQVDYSMLFFTLLGWLVFALVLFYFSFNRAKKIGRLGKMM